MPTHLHVHSWYSLLEGTSGPESLLRRATISGYRSLALTDTNNLYGAVAFTELAYRHGIRPLLGACLRHDGVRCVVLLADPSGYRSLCRIISRLNLAEVPVRLTELLCDNAVGLHVLVDDAVLAEQLFATFAGRLWLEIVRPGRSQQHERELLAAGRRLGIPIVASTAAHMASPAEYPAFRVATAVKRGIMLDQMPGRYLYVARALSATVVNQMRRTEQNTDVNDITFIVIKKSHVCRLRLR